MISIPIVKEHISTQKKSLIKNSAKEAKFVNEVIALFSKIDASNIVNTHDLDDIVKKWADIVNYAWLKHLKFVNITKCSKSWWNDKCNCNQDLASYRLSKSIKSWKNFQKSIKHTKREFFELKIQEIANNKRSLWNLINWVNKKNS